MGSLRKRNAFLKKKSSWEKIMGVKKMKGFFRKRTNKAISVQVKKLIFWWKPKKSKGFLRKIEFFPKKEETMKEIMVVKEKQGISSKHKASSKLKSSRKKMMGVLEK